MARTTIRTILTTGVCTAAIVALLLSSADKTRAQGALAGVQTFSVPAQPLSRSLTALARTYGIRLVYQSDLTRNLRGAALAGDYTPEQALGKLLAGTSLTYRVTSERTIAVFDRAAIDAHAQNVDLSTITVEGGGGNPNAVIGNLPQPYAGGQIARGGSLGVLGNLDFMSTPFNTTSYTDQFKIDTGATSIGDVLRYSPSVVAAASGPNNTTDAFYMRGFWAGSESVLLDGLGGFGFRRAQLEPIERVELLLGPSAFLHGQPTAVGGMVNLVPKRAGDQPLTELGLSWSTRSVFNGTFDVGRRFGDKKEFGVRVNGGWSKGELPIADTHRDAMIGSAAFDYRTDRFRWTFDYINHDRTMPAEAWFYLDPGVPMPDAKRASRAFQPKWTLYESSQQIAMSRAEVDLTDRWTISAAYGYSWMNDHRVSQVYGVTDAAGTLFAGGSSDYRGKFHNYSGELLARGEVDTGPVLHRLRFGMAEFGGDSRSGWRGSPGTASTNIYAPTYPDNPVQPSSFDPYKNGDSTVRSYFAADQMSILNDRVQFIVGARHVKYVYDYFNGTTGMHTDSYTESALTPAYAAVIRPLQWLSFYANFVEALEPGYRVDPAGGAANAGQLLTPQHTKQKEIGAKTDFGTIAATLSVFEITKPNVTLDPVTNIEGYNGEQVSKGLEVNVFGEPIKGVRVLGGFSLLNAELTKTTGGTNDGKRPSGVPRYTIVGHVDWDLPWVQGLAARAGILHTGGIYADDGNTQMAPSWTRVDAGLRYAFKAADRDVTLRFNVDNLFDKHYWQIERGTIYAGAGRTYTVSGVVKF